MRFPVRVFFRCVSSILIFFLLLQFFASGVFAQTQQSIYPQQSFTRPSVEENVPLNQHTYVQSMFIEFMLAIQCQITGIDLARQGQPCLGINIKSGQLGYAPPEAYQNGQLAGGGMMGMISHGISIMFVPVADSQDYIRYVAGEFGIVKTAMAAPATGFEGLSPVLGLWKAARDIAYYILIVAFIFIGIGVMLRVHIDPRTVMTVQNQIPRVIICIILITFSYALAGLLIDTMWAITYMGINKLTSATGLNPPVGSNCPTLLLPDTLLPGQTEIKLDEAATNNILQQPLMFFDKTFMEHGCESGGILDLSGNVGAAMAAIQTDLLNQLLIPDCDLDDNPWWSYAPVLLPFTLAADATSCVVEASLHTWIRWLTALAWILIALVIIIVALLRIWFTLLKAYAMTFLYVILGPLWIVMGLLPKKPLGFEKWIRVLFANLAVFPATAFLLVLARVLTDKFSRDADTIFLPPLVGNPGAVNLGAIVAFAILLVTPSILDTLRESLGVKPSKAYQGAVQTFNMGRQAATYPAKQAVKHLNARDQQGNAIGFLAGLKDAGTDKIAQRVGRLGSIGKFLTKGHDKKEYQKTQPLGSVAGYKDLERQYNVERKEAYGRSRKEGKQFDQDYGGSVVKWDAERQAQEGALQSSYHQAREAAIDRGEGKAFDDRYNGSVTAWARAEQQQTAPAPTGPGGQTNISITLNTGTGGPQTRNVSFASNSSARDAALTFVAPIHRPAAEAAWDAQHGDISNNPAGDHSGEIENFLQGIANQNPDHVVVPPPTSGSV